MISCLRKNSVIINLWYRKKELISFLRKIKNQFVLWKQLETLESNKKNAQGSTKKISLDDISFFHDNYAIFNLKSSHTIT
jgi:hypothetical protein